MQKNHKKKQIQVLLQVNRSLFLMEKQNYFIFSPRIHIYFKLSLHILDD